MTDLNLITGKGRYRARMRETNRALDGAREWLEIMGFKVQAEELKKLRMAVSKDMNHTLQFAFDDHIDDRVLHGNKDITDKE